MQKSFNEDFDLQVRSIMEEAQEPAPAGAWEAISARLDAMAAATAASAASASGSAAAASSAGASSAAARGARRVWYWAGAALAMAAAVALAVFFTGTSENNSNLININDGSALVAEAAQPAQSAQLAVQPTSGMQNAPIRIQSAQKPASGMQNTPVLHTETADPVVQSAESSDENASVAEPATEPAAEATPATEPAPEKPAADPFALMAYEDSRKSSRRTGFSLSVSGGASSNNAGSGKLSMGAPGGKYLQAGITETSKSSFGIPVVVGLGVRLQLSDVLSLGTGLDYSLLSRTFEGKYTEGLLSVKSGDFNHTLQYIGIPVDLFVKLLEKKDISLYSTAGVEAEYAISNKYRLLGTDTVVGDSVNGLQWSIGGGFGLEFNPGQRVGIFAEPTFKYYFNCDQPKNIRTDKPFQMILRAGVRFRL